MSNNLRTDDIDGAQPQSSIPFLHKQTLNPTAIYNNPKARIMPIGFTNGPEGVIANSDSQKNSMIFQ